MPQTSASNRSITHTRGKVLGGSSAINLFVWNRASVKEYDAWEELGNPGWNWKSMYAAMLRVENFQRESLNEEVQYGQKGVAYGGSIDTTMVESPPVHMRSGLRTLENLGWRKNIESLGGNNIGSMYQPATKRLSNHTRSYAADYLPRVGTNLVILPNTTVAKIVLNKKADKATGVVLFSGLTLKAKREVILSAGSLLTPKLLELSGIGQKTVLEKAGIKQLVNLPGVGENLQDHLRIQNTYELKPEIPAFDVLKYNATRAAQELALYRNDQPSLYQYAGSGYGFNKWTAVQGSDAKKLLQLAKQSIDPNNAVDRKKLQLLVDVKSAPDLQIVISDGYTGPKGYPRPGMPGHAQNYATVFAGITRPFARGSVHITSSSPTANPAIDPRFLSTPYDLEALKQGAQFVRRVAQTAPFKDIYTKEFDPGISVNTDAEWEQWVKDNVWTFFHPLGTCAMMPRREGGVVDAELRVYGVSNLKIVDASVIPIVVSGNIQTAVYGIAERAAEIIARKYGK